MADWISMLPDEILSHILSFLSTEDAFTTSFLSKRLTSLWLLLPNLNIDDVHFFKSGKSKSLFRKMISILVQNVHQQNIKTFRLRCGSVSNYFESEDTSATNFKLWLTTAAERGMEHLQIHSSWIFYHLGFIFSLRTLVVLELKAVYVYYNFGIVYLPSLKTLRLNKVDFLLEIYLPNLLYGCPNLVEFEGISLSVTTKDPDIEYRCTNNLSKLTRANISTLSDFNIPIEVFSSVEFIRFKEIYEDDLPVFSNLTRVEVDYVGDVYWKLVFGVFENCPKLQNFFLGKPKILKSEDILWYSPCVVPQCLSLQFRKCAVTNYIGEKYEFEFVKYIMQNSTSIKVMAIQFPTSLDPQRVLELQNEIEHCI